MTQRGRVTPGRVGARALLAAVLVAGLVLAGCQTAIRVGSDRVASIAAIKDDAPVFPASLPSAPRGEALWREVCPGCDASGFTETYLGRDRRQTAPVEIYWALTDGVPEKGLPALKDRLTLDQRWDVVFYIWSRNVSREGLAAAGQAYLKNCAMCHGPQGRGDGSAASYLEPPAANFTLAEKYVAFKDVDLFQFISNGKPGTAMPPWGDVLSVEERWALVDHIRTFMYDVGRED